MKEWAVLALVALGTFMTALDASIVDISRPSIARTFLTPIGGAVQWVVNRPCVWAPDPRARATGGFRTLSGSCGNLPLEYPNRARRSSQR